MSRHLQTSGCGCCTYDYEVEVIGRFQMPDGKTIYQLKDTDGEATWWYDKDLEVHWGDEWD